jgi:hypothetical protein
MAGNKLGIVQQTDVVIVKQPLVGLKVSFNGQTRPVEARLAGDEVELEFGNFKVAVQVIALNGIAKLPT